MGRLQKHLKSYSKDDQAMGFYHRLLPIQKDIQTLATNEKLGKYIVSVSSVVTNFNTLGELEQSQAINTTSKYTTYIYIYIYNVCAFIQLKDMLILNFQVANKH